MNQPQRKLELKDIACYLPYGLTVNVMGEHDEDMNFTKFTLKGLDGDWAYLISDSHYVSDLFPLLRPLSSLTKPITHNGETFIPIVELASIAESDHFNRSKTEILTGNQTFGCGWSDISDDDVYVFIWAGENNGFYLESTNGKRLIVANQSLLFEKMYEWMIDYKGLIDAGLAIELID